MPTVIERLGASVSTNVLDELMGAQGASLQQAIALATQLASSPPRELDDFTGLLSGLTPSFSIAGNVQAAISNAHAAVPADLTSLLTPARQVLDDFSGNIVEQLSPLLGDAVKVAAAIQQLLTIKLGCEPAAAPADPTAPPDPAPGPTATREGVQRTQAVADQINQVSTLLDQLPAGVTPIFLLNFLLQRLGGKDRDRFFSINVPVLDDLLNPLQTLASLSLLDADGIRSQFATSLGGFTTHLEQVITAPLGDLETRFNATLPGIDTTAIGNAVSTLAGGYIALAAALQTADTASADALTASIGAALDAFETLRTSFESSIGPALPQLNIDVLAFPQAALDRLEQLLSLLQPANLTSSLTSLASLPTAPTDEAVQAVQEALAPVFTWINDLVEALDFSALESQVAAVAGTLRDISNQLTASLTQVGAQARALFQGVSDAVNGIPLADVETALLAQIDAFSDLIRAQINAAFAPLRTALTDAVALLSGAAGQFDPQAIVAALQDILQTITDTLTSSEVTAAINAVKDTVQSVANALNALSFAPVTDEVVQFIEQMRKALQTALDADINGAAKSAITAGLSVLPDDLQPVTDPLVDDFAALIAGGPIPLLQRIAEEPQKLLAELQRFEPGTLIGNGLGAPFRELIGKLDGLSVTQLIEPAERAFDAQKQHLRQAVNPGQALQPISTLLAELNERLAALSPNVLLEPLNQSLQSAINQVIDASPVDEVFAVVNDVFASINGVFAVLDNLRGILSKVNAIVASFGNSAAQVDAWRDGLLDNIAASAGGAIDSALATLGQSVATVSHAQVVAAFDQRTQALLTALGTLAPGSALASLALPYGQCVARAQSLPASATKNAVLTLLARFDPLDAADNAPLRLLQGLRESMVAARQTLVALQPTWNAAAAELAALPQGALNGDALRTALEGAIEPVLAPVRALFTVVERNRAPLAAVLASLDGLAADVTTKAAALLTGPNSLQAINASLQDLVNDLRNFDLGILTQGADAALADVRGQLSALDPARIAAALNQAFADSLDALDLSALLPSTEIAALDAALDDIRTALSSLDPDAIIVSAVQPIYDEGVLPLVNAFDLTPVFQALIDYLDQLDDELRSELLRVNTAYKGFIGTRGSGGGVSASVGG